MRNRQAAFAGAHLYAATGDCVRSTTRSALTARKVFNRRALLRLLVPDRIANDAPGLSSISNRREEVRRDSKYSPDRGIEHSLLLAILACGEARGGEHKPEMNGGALVR